MDHSPPSVAITTLGRFAVAVGGEEVTTADWGSRRARILLKRLIAYLPHGVPHSFQVLSDEACMIAITATVNGTKPQFDQMVAALGAPSATPTQPEPAEINPGEVAEVNARYGIAILGPPQAPLPE